MDVGIRELRNSLSEQLALVRDGHTVTITSHGKPVARIVPVDQPTKLEQLRAAGHVREPHRSKRVAQAPLQTAGTVSDLLDEQRR
ncbi:MULTISPECIES: type II toxin-antitoxin system Phd/YefM family antitoxin [Aeromicrobium]|uniref:type II toxin-antitoxin system Phd/YefM family antitoxin n=1 Tax=Aeromicrobium TaxID=2040 RepID=UPI0006FA65A3|nr:MULTISPECIES: type II toxin-antitoxin system prevent-host-death family antitoxin [Aeromicrobium]KQX74281.1 prevent-host-death protein [Aeromicrobium sp. Root472D3]MBD8608549.1 type II toxin-antitoxin system prevent-host-death family antitoxin [Aeromicrobium sp. CFBP 8757]MCL8249789.1 type II toxin-antitoxin system prevent-host-death family antitoxin [Aeromicrobium fastidiosum]